MPATDTAPVDRYRPDSFAAASGSTCGLERCGDVFNPSTGQVIARVPFCSAEQTADGGRSGRGGAAGVGETPVVERARVMFRFRALLEQHFEELAALVTREHGKTLAEARAEVQRGIEVVEFACGIPEPDHGRIAAEHRGRRRCGERSAIRSASASASRRTTSRRWCRCGCSRSRSPAATRSC